MFDTYGSDAVRWALMSSPVLRGGNLVVAEENIREGVRQVLLPLWSTWYFFTLYAGAANGGAGYDAQPVTAERVAGLPVLDRYLLARTHDLVERATVHLDAFEIAAACEDVRDHLDMLTNWYVRTQRDRFWSEDADAFDTLFTALEALTRVMAPLAPMVAEEVWRGLTGGRSLHLTDWPTAGGALVADPDLVAAMDRVREVVSTTLGLRKANGLRVRQPLRELGVAVADPGAIEPYTALLAAELNVKHVTLVDLAEVGLAELGVEQRLAVNARAAGPAPRTSGAGGDPGGQGRAVDRGRRTPWWSPRTTGRSRWSAGEYELATVVAEGGSADQVAAVLSDGGVVLLDTAVDAELEAEGFARDVVRAVQDERKAAGLQVSDRIALVLTVPAERVAALEAHLEMVSRETLATRASVVAGDAPDGAVAGVGPRGGRVSGAAGRPADTPAELDALQEVYAGILARAPEHDVAPSTERVEAVCDLLGHPERAYRVLHVAGTNGKTSTSRMAERLLREHGLRTGLFTSPHLTSVTERIQVDGEPLSAAAFVAAWQDVAPYVHMVDARSAETGGPRMSFFEVLTVMAFAAFADAPVDVAVIEVGMGGRWDATNVVEPEVAVITPIARDHERWLGHDLVDIAGEKAGVLKEHVTAVIAEQREEVEGVLLAAAAERGARVLREGIDLEVAGRQVAVGGQVMDLRTPGGLYTGIFVPLHGEHQAHNAVLALSAVEAMLRGVGAWTPRPWRRRSPTRTRRAAWRWCGPRPP